MTTDTLNEVSLAMSEISFNNALLDAALLEIEGPLTCALGGKSPGTHLSDKEENRLGAAQALAFAGALINLEKIDDLEELMFGVEFLDYEDSDELKIVKGVMFDCLLTEKIYESTIAYGRHLSQLQASASRILNRHGYAGLYFSPRGIL